VSTIDKNKLFKTKAEESALKGQEFYSKPIIDKPPLTRISKSSLDFRTKNVVSRLS
jgi:hypothetical protein